MIQPAKLDLIGNRYTPLVYNIPIALDLSDATFRAQVRLSPSAGGDPLIDLTNNLLGLEGIFASVEMVGGEPISTVIIRIDETTMEGLPAVDAPDENTRLAWDLHVTRPGYSKAVWFRGDFLVTIGATH